MSESFDAMAASGNKDGQRGKKRFEESYIFNTLVREYRKSRAAKESQELRDNDGISKVVDAMETCGQRDGQRGKGGLEVVIFWRL